MRTFGWLVVALLAGACGEAGSGLPVVAPLSEEGAVHQTPSYSPDGSKVAYWSRSTDRANAWDLWLADADLGNPVRLPVTSLAFGAAIWSPDGTTLAAASSDFGLADVVTVTISDATVKRVTTAPGFEVPTGWWPDNDRLSYLASADGSFGSFVVSTSTGVATPLLPGETRPLLGIPSPDGKHIGYNIIDGGKFTIWVADSLGQNPRQLTTEGFESPASPSWSPDSREILYQSSRTGTTDIWVAPIDGSDPRQLTRDVRNDFSGAWSPDGKWVAFLSDRGRQTDVWIVPSAGGEELRITDNVLAERDPVWRPGQPTLSYAVLESSTSIVARNLADGSERRMVPDSVRTTGFWLSPDGTHFLYRIDRGAGTDELVVAPLAGGPETTLVPAGGNIATPAWSPDGSQVVYVSNRTGTDDLWIVETGGTPRQLLNWTGSAELNPVFNGDGSAVIFVSDRESRLTDLWQIPVGGGDPARLTTSGSVQGPSVVPGGRDIFAQTISEEGGILGISRIGADGKTTPVWERTNVLGAGVAPSGDSVAAWVEQPDGSQRVMLLGADGGGGRALLEPGVAPGLWSPDGRSLLYYITVNGAQDIGLLEVATGKTRVLTNTPESEDGGELTHDGAEVVFNRRQTSQRLFSADLSKLLGKGQTP